MPSTVLLRALGYGTEEIIKIFYETYDYTLQQGEIFLKLIPERLRGEMADFDIVIDKKTTIKEGRRITAKHIRQIVKAGLKDLKMPGDHLLGKMLAEPLVDKETGEVIAAVNAEITEELFQTIVEAGITEIKTLYVNDLFRTVTQCSQKHCGRQFSATVDTNEDTILVVKFKIKPRTPIILRALGYGTEEIIKIFYETNEYILRRGLTGAHHSINFNQRL